MILITYDNHDKLENVLTLLPLSDPFAFSRNAIPFLTSDYIVRIDVPNKNVPDIKLKINNRWYSQFTTDPFLNAVYFRVPQKTTLQITKTNQEFDYVLENGLKIKYDTINFSKSSLVYINNNTIFEENKDYVFEFDSYQDLQIRWVSNNKPSVGQSYFIDLYFNPFMPGTNEVSVFINGTIFQSIQAECKNILSLLLWISLWNDVIVQNLAKFIDYLAIKTSPDDIVYSKYKSLINYFFYLTPEQYKKVLSTLIKAALSSGTMHALKQILSIFVDKNKYNIVYYRNLKKWKLITHEKRYLSTVQYDTDYVQVRTNPNIYRDNNVNREHWFIKPRIDTFKEYTESNGPQKLQQQIKTIKLFSDILLKHGLLIQWKDFNFYNKQLFVKSNTNILLTGLSHIIKDYKKGNIIYPILYRNTFIFLNEILYNGTGNVTVRYYGANKKILNLFIVGEEVFINGDIATVIEFEPDRDEFNQPKDTGIITLDRINVQQNHSVGTRIIPKPYSINVSLDGKITINNNVAQGTELVFECYFIPYKLINECLDLIKPLHVTINHEFYDENNKLYSFYA